MLGGGLGPRIVSITSDATSPGTLNAGNSIRFVLTLASPAPGAYVSGSYDGVPLTWTSYDGGTTYSATFTVQNTNPSTSAPLQISGVTVRDAAGNVSVAANGYDVQRTINSQSFVITQISPVSSPVASGASPRFSFYSPQDGSITYGGSCSSMVMSAITGNTYVTFNPLSDGTYSNCTVTLTNAAGYKSNTLTVPTFTVGYGTTSSVTPAQTSSANTNTSTYAYKFYNPLKVGSTGADVSALQKRLKSEGVYTGAITGTYGALTEAAVKKYQKAHGLTQLGNVGPGTRAALNAGY
jgi:hypothetical protein